MIARITGVFGLIGLQQGHTLFLRPPGPSRDLTHQLERALGGPQIRPLQPQIRVDHPHQGEVGKVMPLGHQLRADDDIRVALGNVANGGLERTADPNRSDDSTETLASGKRSVTSSARRSTPGPTGANRPST